MDEPLKNEEQTPQDQPQTAPADDQIAKLRADYESRLVAANLRTEAVRAGMIDLDGLKLLDLSSVTLDGNDKIVDGRKIMDSLRREKPWLFGATSSSSAAVAPASQPVRQKTALEMTDEEYAAARAALTRHRL
nr:hypothetical protein [uncultured Rhodopila sp.]